MRSLFLMCIVILLSISLTYSGETDELLNRIEESYKRISDMVADFEQRSVLVDLKKTVTYKGKLYVKIPSRFRWIYSGDDSQEVFINDDTLIVYNKKEKQAIRSLFSKERFGSVPIAILGGLGDMKKDFHVSQVQGKIILKPRTPVPGIMSIELTPAEGHFPVKRLKIIDTNKNTIEIILNNVRVNTGLDDSLFIFNPSEKVRIIEGLY